MSWFNNQLTDLQLPHAFVITNRHNDTLETLLALSTPIM